MRLVPARPSQEVKFETPRDPVAELKNPSATTKFRLALVNEDIEGARRIGFEHGITTQEQLTQAKTVELTLLSRPCPVDMVGLDVYDRDAERKLRAVRDLMSVLQRLPAHIVPPAE